MPQPLPEALDFLLSRRSRPAKTLSGPAPDEAALQPILTAALRSPDHGKLEPWRLIVLSAPAMQRLSGAVAARGAALGMAPERVEKEANTWATSPLCVAVVESPKDNPKVPEIEQTYSAGAVCLALLNAALASGWGANWLSGWASHDRPFVEAELGLAPHERIAGLIHLGTETSTPPERPRPDLAALTQWVAE